MIFSNGSFFVVLAFINFLILCVLQLQYCTKEKVDWTYSVIESVILLIMEDACLTLEREFKRVCIDLEYSSRSLETQCKSR